MHGARELGDLAAQEVDAPGLVALVAEDGALDLVDVVLQALDHRLVVVDDLVEHRPEDRRRAELRYLRMLLEALARAAQVARLAMAHDDDIAVADEDVDLAELDLLARVVVAGRLQHDEVGVAP